MTQLNTIVYVNTEATFLWDCFFWLQGCSQVCAKGEGLGLLYQYPLHPKSSASSKDKARASHDSFISVHVLLDTNSSKKLVQTSEEMMS